MSSVFKTRLNKVCERKYSKIKYKNKCINCFLRIKENSKEFKNTRMYTRIKTLIMVSNVEKENHFVILNNILILLLLIKYIIMQLNFSRKLRREQSNLTNDVIFDEQIKLPIQF